MFTVLRCLIAFSFFFYSVESPVFRINSSILCERSTVVDESVVCIDFRTSFAYYLFRR